MKKVKNNSSVCKQYEKQLKTYKERLDTVSRVRYDEKLKLINDVDPYELKTKDLSTDVDLFPDLGHTDIINYLVFTPSPYTADDLKAYKGLEAYNQFVCGWVSGVCCMVVNGRHLIKARVMHSQRMREKPLSPWVIAEKSGMVLASHCDCMAGIGETCTHVAALLFYIDTAVRLRSARTVTQEKAYWLLPSAVKGASYNEIRDIDFSSAKTLKRKLDASVDSPSPVTVAKKQRKCVPEASEQELAGFFKALKQIGRKPALLTIHKEYSDSYVPKPKPMPKKLSSLRDNDSIKMNYRDLVNKCADIEISVSEEEAKNVEALTRRQSDNRQWFEYRAGRVTASNMKTTCCTDPANPAQSLIKKICYPSKVFQNEATKWGIQNESQAKKELLNYYKQNHQNAQLLDSGLHISTEKSFIAASPDGVLNCDCCAKACVEVKCPFSKKGLAVSEVSYLKIGEDDKLHLDKSHEYFYQVQTQLGCTGYDSCYFVVWTGVDVHVEHILFDVDLWKVMCEKAELIFKIAILPEIVGKFYTKLPNSDMQKTLLPLGGKVPFTESKNPEHTQSQAGTLTNTVPANTNYNPTNSRDKVSVVSTEERWCYCDQVEFGDMVYCDNENCPIKWFHFTCLKITRKPKSKLWYCPDCRKLKKKM